MQSGLWPPDFLYRIPADISYEVRDGFMTLPEKLTKILHIPFISCGEWKNRKNSNFLLAFRRKKYYLKKRQSDVCDV